MCLQNILSTNTPFKTKSNQLLSLLHSPLNNISINLLKNKSKEPIDDRIKDFIQDIEQNFIKKWYSSYISTNEEFLIESSKLLDIIIRRFLQIAGQINSEKVLHGTVTILLRHVKEYKKAVKKAKNDGSVESHYRYGHLGSKSEKCFEHFALQITSKTLRHFIHWELYNSVACRCLNAILAKKLISHMVHTLSSPGFINFNILIVFDDEKKKVQYVDKYQAVSISNVDHKEVKNQPIEDIEDIEPPKEEETTKVIPKEEISEETVKVEKPEVKDEVKVYESKSSNKTWRHSSDLDCISLGQDILFLSNIEEDTKPDWTQLAEDFSSSKKKVTVKDTMKDLQQSTTNAMHKIEEGILDLGIGIRKGLRLTGLQDSTIEARPKSQSKDIPQSTNRRDTRLTKLSHVNSDIEESFEDIYMNPLHEIKIREVKEEEVVITPGYEGDILLERSPMIEKLPSNDIPTMEFVHVEDSPEPEYEDNPDLATTTAKLRSLLAQKTEANTPAASPMSLIPTPQDASGSSVDELSEVDGALPSMYKAWAKNVFQNTLNTIKTALPGNASEETCVSQVVTLAGLNLVQYNDENWHFEETSPDESEFSSVLGRFLSERQQFCVVENAFEAVETIDLNDQMEGSFILHEEGKYEEELDDFDTTIPITKALVDLVCELIEETYPPLVKENIIKTFLLTYGAVVEEKLQELSQQLIKSIAYSIGHLPKMESRHVAMSMKIEDLVEPIAASLRDIFGQWLADDSIRSVLRLLMESIQSHKINVDTSLQVLELFISEVISACNQTSPTYSV